METIDKKFVENSDNKYSVKICDIQICIETHRQDAELFEVFNQDLQPLAAQNIFVENICKSMFCSGGQRCFDWEEMGTNPI